MCKTAVGFRLGLTESLYDGATEHFPNSDFYFTTTNRDPQASIPDRFTNVHSSEINKFELFFSCVL